MNYGPYSAPDWSAEQMRIHRSHQRKARSSQRRAWRRAAGVTLLIIVTVATLVAVGVSTTSW